MRRIQVGLAAALLLLATERAYDQITLDQGPQFAEVHIQAVDILGHQLQHPKFDLAPIGTREKPGIESATGEFSKIPYGRYTLRVTAPGFDAAEQALDVAHDQVWMTAALLAWDAHVTRPKPILAGEVIPPISDRTAWAKLVGVYNDVTLETAITGNRFFHFEPKAPGVYVLMVVGDGRVLDIRQVEILEYKRIQLQLAK